MVHLKGKPKRFVVECPGLQLLYIFIQNGTYVSDIGVRVEKDSIVRMK